MHINPPTHTGCGVSIEAEGDSCPQFLGRMELGVSPRREEVRVGALQGAWPRRCGTPSSRGLGDHVRSEPDEAVLGPYLTSVSHPLTGHHVSRECDGNRPTCCRPCAAGTFMPHSNREDECLPCTQCRDGEWRALCLFKTRPLPPGW